MQHLLTMRVLMLAEFTKSQPSPWGIMTGIRPTKIVHRLFDIGLTSREINKKLATDFDLAPDKAALITEISLRQRIFLPAAPGAGKEIGIYY